MIKIEDLCIRYGEKTVIDGLNLSIGDGITCLVGESGCGKTTLLRAIAGLAEPDAGRIEGRPKKPIFMFQEDRLLPWLSARENVALVIPHHAAAEQRGTETETGRGRRGGEVAAETEAGRGRKKHAAAADRAGQLLELVGLGADADRLPGELSGGMKRRVALARALAADKDLLILDEPFTGLDPKLAAEMMELIRNAGVPVIMTSHDTETSRLPYVTVIEMKKHE